MNQYMKTNLLIQILCHKIFLFDLIAKVFAYKMEEFHQVIHSREVLSAKVSKCNFNLPFENKFSQKENFAGT